jgi:VCBS repeat-containing protein
MPPTTASPTATATDTFTYTVSDGQGGTSTTTLTVTITGTNDAPVVLATTANVSEEGLAGGEADTRHHRHHQRGEP